MDGSENVIHLYGTENYVAEASGKDVYMVQSGTVLVFIAPLIKGRTGSQVYLCDVEEGHLIPAFHYTDIEHVQWRFIFKSKDEADLVILPGKSTSVLCKKFAIAAGLGNSNESFEQRLVEHHRRQVLKDEVIIDYSGKHNKEVQKDTSHVIKQSFKRDDEQITGDTPVYRAMAYACKKASIPLVSSEKLSLICGDDITVPAIARASRFACRDVVLEQGWYRRDSGTIVGFIDDRPVACVPRGQGSYTVFYGDTNQAEPLTQQTAETINPRAFALYRTLPGKGVSTKELISFGSKSIRRADLLVVVILGLTGALIGILLPYLNQKIYDEYIPLGNVGQLVQICVVIASFMIGNLFFDMVKKLSEYRIGSHVAYDLQNAVYYRVLNLPQSFFRTQESADLAQRLAYIGSIANTFISSTLISGLGSIFSLLYLYRMFKYSSKLSWIAALMLAIYAALLFFISRRTISIDKMIEKSKGEASARLYQFLNGIEKLRIAGAEDRAAYEYIVPFAEKQSLEIRKNRFSAWSTVITGSASVIFSMVFYYIIVKSKINLSTGAFMGFNSAFGSFSASILNMISSALTLYQLKPLYERVKPVLETEPEDNEEKSVPGPLQGGIELRGVKFAYDKNGVNVLNGIDLAIKPGEYIGIVGSSGCGKSTLLKLLLGFEEPDQGHVLYDGVDLKSLDKRELRKKLGVVLQSGKLISGSIYENITITAPHANMDTVMKTIETVGLKNDIAQMPMGIHTVLSENSGTISGGQQQRILIARAIISDPTVLIFDEATSALDNVTQAAICENLDKMKATRIVVAHRLSTIKNCDRIIVMNGGVIQEEGTYDQLMALGGLFRQLADRQLA